MEGKSARSARVSFVLEPLGELLEVLLQLVVLFLVILQALIIRLVSFVTILEGRRCRRVSHICAILFIQVGSEALRFGIEGTAPDRPAVSASHAALASLLALTVPLPAVLRVGLLQLLALLVYRVVRRAAGKSRTLLEEGRLLVCCRWLFSLLH